jgi:hypothetical protein
MLNWFKKSDKKSAPSQKETVVIVNPGDYPAKIILAWSKAIEGNKDILRWLSENG